MEIKMECQNYGCTETAVKGRLCCSGGCGYDRRCDQNKLEYVLEDVVGWKERVWGISDWSVGKYLHYLSLINNKK